MAVELLLDSVILIDHFNRIPKARAYLERVQDRAAISVVTRAETLTGYPEEVQGKIRRLLDRFHIYEVDTTVADIAALLRRRHGWKLPDAFQAAIVQHHGLRLATRNTRHFDPARHSFVVVPYEL